MYGLVFKTTNLATDKIYVGQTIRTEMINEDLFPMMPSYKRYIGSGDNIKIAIKKHGGLDSLGDDVFVTEVLDIADNQKELDDKEIFWIADLQPEYNIESGGNGIGKLAESTKRKLSEAHKGKKLSEAHRIKLSEAARGKKHSEETKVKISEAQIGQKRKPFSEQTRKNMSAAQIGKKYTEETKRRMSISAKNRWSKE